MRGLIKGHRKAVCLIIVHSTGQYVDIVAFSYYQIYTLIYQSLQQKSTYYLTYIAIYLYSSYIRICF